MAAVRPAERRCRGFAVVRRDDRVSGIGQRRAAQDRNLGMGRVQLDQAGADGPVGVPPTRMAALSESHPSVPGSTGGGPRWRGVARG